MTKHQFDKVFDRFEPTYTLKGDIQITHNYMFTGDLIVGNNSLKIHDSEGTLNGVFALDQIISARSIKGGTSTIVIASDFKFIILSIYLHQELFPSGSFRETSEQPRRMKMKSN